MSVGSEDGRLGTKKGASFEAIAGHNDLPGALVDPFPVHGDFVEHFFAQTGAAALGEFAQGSLTHRSAQERVGARVRSDVVGVIA